MIDEDQILDSISGDKSLRRRKLLPKWIIVFTWIFMIMGGMIPVFILLSLIGLSGNLELYGLQASNSLSLIGIIITLLFALKGIAAFGLWTEKDWAIDVGMIDALIGMVVCAFVMIAPLVGENSDHSFHFRFEFILLVPYFMKLREISGKWKNRSMS